MGGCVSTPKDLALNEGEKVPLESPNTTQNAEGETTFAQDQNTQEGGDEKKEEPLVDHSVSENKEEKKEEAKPEEAHEVVATETKEEPAKEEAKAEQPRAEAKIDEPLVTL